MFNILVMMKMKYFFACLLFVCIQNVQSQKYTLISNEVFATLNIDSFKATSAIINATITITNNMSHKIFIPIIPS